jgi:hypothetical protein
LNCVNFRLLPRHFGMALLRPAPRLCQTIALSG